MIFFIVVFILYAIFIGFSIIGFQINSPSSFSIKDFKSSKEKLLTIIIPFRNEENRINNLLSSIENQENLNIIIQFIFVDDHSSDCTVEIIKNWTLNKNFKCQILSLKSDFGKKKAIDFGVKSSNSEYIMTIDADITFNHSFFANLKNKLATNSDLYLISVIEDNGLFISRIISLVLGINTPSGCFSYYFPHLHQNVFCCNKAFLLLHIARKVNNRSSPRIYTLLKLSRKVFCLARSSSNLRWFRLRAMDK